MEPNSLMMMSRTPTPPQTSSPHIKPETVHSFGKVDENSRDSVTSYTAEESAMRQNQVGTVILHAVPIVSLFIDGHERLCLAQISNTLLKEYSYNEIHNRRVALGITCVQCTPVQLEILRRAGAMPISSRRCGMISKREAERLVKSFLEEHMPPKLPENFAFCVKHSCGWGCKGQFVPSRYNSSRAKCIKCTYCSLFFSPNKFIFHFHRAPDAKYRHPDAANFNSWRRHLFLDYSAENEDLVHAWEDVKAMFNGGSRKRVLGSMIKPDVDYLSFEKKSKYDTEQAQMRSFPIACPQQSTSNQQSPYPFIPMTNAVNQNTMVMPYQAQPNYPVLPRSANTPIKAMHDPAKMNFSDMWKNRTTPMYNPFGLWWAKSLGMPGFSQSTKSPFPVDWGFWQNNKEAHAGDSKTDIDSRYSAFKPVGLLGSRVFSEYNRNPTPCNEKSSHWEHSKELMNNNRQCFDAESISRDNKSSPVYKDYTDAVEQPPSEPLLEDDHENSCGSDHGSNMNMSPKQDPERDFDICVDESQESKHTDEAQRNTLHDQSMFGPPKTEIQEDAFERSRYHDMYKQTETDECGNADQHCETRVTTERQSQPEVQTESSHLSALTKEDQDSRLEGGESLAEPAYRDEDTPRDIYQMSKEELQKELLKMMGSRGQNSQ